MNDSGQQNIKKEEQNNKPDKPEEISEYSDMHNQVIWHFVLKQLDEGTPLGHLKANIMLEDVSKEYFVYGVYNEDDKDMHFYIETQQDGKLNSAVAHVKEQADPKKAKLVFSKIYKKVRPDEDIEKKYDNEDIQPDASELISPPPPGGPAETDKNGDDKLIGGFSLISRTTIILISLIFLFAVLFNVFIVEFEKYEIKRILQQQEETTARLSERLENIKKELAEKNKETSDLIDFHNSFVPVWAEYHNSIKMISSDNALKSADLNGVITLTEKRVEIAKKYLSDFNGLVIPEILQNFYKSNTAFIESDIKLWEAVLDYYNMNNQEQLNANNPEQSDSSKIEGIANESKILFENAQNELAEIYKSHDLSYFLKEYE